jgi:hypothetical protein
MIIGVLSASRKLGVPPEFLKCVRHLGTRQRYRAITMSSPESLQAMSLVIGSLYQYFSVTYLSVGLMVAESVFQIIAHAIEGAVAGAIYKAAVLPKIEAARVR